MSAHSNRTISTASACFAPAHFGFFHSHDSSRAPRFRSVNDRDGQSTRYALLIAIVYAAEPRSEEHTSELQSPDHLVCRLLLEKKTHNSAHSWRSSDAIRHSPPPPTASAARLELTAPPKRRRARSLSASSCHDLPHDPPTTLPL